MKRGLTMIEMLLALVLLSAVVAAAMSWTAVAGRLGVSTVGPIHARNVVESTFALIEDDLVTGDFIPPQASRSASDQHSRVRIEDGALHIDTRAGRTAIYRVDRSARVLERIERAQNSSPPRRLIGNVKELTCALEETQRILIVTIATDEPFVGSLTRKYGLP